MTTAEILIKSGETFNNLEGLSIESTLDFKFVDDKDTSHYYKNISWVKNPNDTILEVNILLADSLYTKFYKHTPDSTYFYRLFHKDSTYNTDYYIDFRDELMGFYKESLVYREFNNDTVLKTRLADREVEGNDCFVIHFGELEENQSELWERFYIDKNTFLPIRNERYYFWEDYNSFQYYDLKINIKSFNKEEIIHEIESFEIPSHYTLDGYEWVQPIPLEDGIKAPDFKGLIVGGDSISLSDYKGQFVILDFWYIGCYWCIKAMPFLEKIQEYYGDKITVLGINPFDGKDQERLKEFIEFKEITYPTISVDNDMPREVYNVSGYPIFYLINKEGVIAGHQSGYRDSLDYYLRQEIDSLLNLE